MTYRHHGLMSMVLFSIAMILGLIMMIQAQAWLGVAGFVFANLVSTLGVAYSYCAKCACRQHACSHFVIGKVADYLPRRAQGPYTPADYAGMLISAGFVFLYPLYWLWAKPQWLIAFVIIGGLGALEILLSVCPSCQNGRCPAAQWKRRIFPTKNAQNKENLPITVEK